VLVDPPSDVPATEVAGWLAAAAAHGWLAEDAVVVVERAGRDGPFPWPPALRAARERRYGDTALHTAVLGADG
jgi:16S rRNA (guanine966-N2)-methyltransferase